jgi:hypothetical protein
MKQRAINLALSFMDKVAFSLGAVLTLWAIWAADTTWFPVVTDFKITSFVKGGQDMYYVGGTLEKKRSCELLALSVYKVSGTDRSVLHQFHKEIFGTDVGVGPIAWGPLPLKFQDVKPTDIIEVKALHRCHAFWLHETEYGRFQFKTLTELE